MDDMDGRNEGESGRRPSAPTPTSSYPPAPRLLDALRERLRHMHYSLRTAEAYVYWVRGFVRWAGGRRHPREMGAAEVQAFLSMLANVLTHVEVQALLAFPCYRATPSSTARATSAS